MAEHSLTAQAVAELVGGRLSGPGEVCLSRVSSLVTAGPDAVAACSGGQWRAALAGSNAGAVLVTPALAGAPGPATRIIVDDPKRAMALLTRELHPGPPMLPGIAPTACISHDATIGDEVSVGPYVIIGTGVRIGKRARIAAHVVIGDDAIIGDDVQLEPHVTIHSRVTLGDRVYCQSGSVIGSAGFGFWRSAEGYQRIPHIGGCVLGSDVEVGAGSCIDRGSLDNTVVGRGTKIDNLVHIGHNVQIGEDCLLMAGVGVAGSTRVGNGVVLAGQAGLAGHIEIGDKAQIGGQAGVISSVPAGGVVSGYPARPHREFLRSQAALRRLTPHVAALLRLASRQPIDPDAAADA